MPAEHRRDACYNSFSILFEGGRTVPLYEYLCAKCHRRTEKIERLAGPHLKKCPHCGGKVERLLGAPAIQFKGSGWYVTDYAGKKSAGGDSGAGKSEATDASKDAPAAKDTSSKDGKDSKEKKAAKKS